MSITELYNTSAVMQAYEASEQGKYFLYGMFAGPDFFDPWANYRTDIKYRDFSHS